MWSEGEKRGPSGNSQWNWQLILEIGIVFSRAWPVKACCRANRCRFYYFVPLNAWIGLLSSAALCPGLDLAFSDFFRFLCAKVLAINHLCTRTSFIIFIITNKL